MLDYYCTVLRAAQRETWALVRAHLLIEVLIAVAVLLVAAVLGPEGLAKGLIACGATVVALLAVVGLLFLWSLTWAPLNLARDDRKRIDELEGLRSSKVEATFAFPTLATLTAKQATELGLDDDIGVIVVLPNVSVINNSASPVEIEAELYVQNANQVLTMLEPAEDTSIPGVDKLLHRFHRRGGQLLSPFRLEPSGRKLGYLVFLFERQYMADMRIMQRKWEAIGTIRLELVDALTQTMVSIQDVPRTIEEFRERLDADREDLQTQST